MALSTRNGSSQRSFLPLLSGIVDDIQTLFQQSLELFRAEVKEDIEKVKRESLYLGVGVVLLGVGGFLLCFMLVYFLNWLWPSLPLWACFGIVGSLLVGGGAGFCYYAKEKLKEVSPLPKKTIEEVEETIECLTNPK